MFKPYESSENADLQQDNSDEPTENDDDDDEVTCGEILCRWVCLGLLIGYVETMGAHWIMDIANVTLVGNVTLVLG